MVKRQTNPSFASAFFILLALLVGTTLFGPSKAVGETSRILFFGDSLTAGYGVDPDEAYPAVVEKMLREKGWTGEVVNAGLSGETTAGGLRRVDWILRQDFDVFVLALGGNDGLRGVNPDVTRENLRAIVEKVRNRDPDTKIVLAGMQAPPNMGSTFTQAFARIFPELAEELDLVLIPFLLEGVGGTIEYNLNDRIHPNPAGHRILAENVYTVIRTVVGVEEKEIKN